MNLTNPEAKISQVVGVSQIDRWLVYRRVQQLELTCQCFANKPLEVEIGNTQEAIQLWSVVKQITSSRRELIDWVDRCWQMNSYKKEE